MTPQTLKSSKEKRQKFNYNMDNSACTDRTENVKRIEIFHIHTYRLVMGSYDENPSSIAKQNESLQRIIRTQSMRN